MLRVVMMATGEEVLALSPEEFESLATQRGSRSARALKEHLTSLTGQTRFRQRLLQRGSIIDDERQLESLS